MNYLLNNISYVDGFWKRYIELITDVVIPYQEQVLNDRIEGIEKSHAIENFKLAAEKLEAGVAGGEFYGMVFQDSDVAKWLEAAAYSLSVKPDAALEKRCDEVIELIGRAQHKDGYLNTYFTVKEPEKRWTNLREAHELYCAGHMIEAAAAYYSATGKASLLNIMTRMADNIYEHFITQKSGGFGGHPEIELALMRLYGITENPKYKELAEYFINERGVDRDFYAKEHEKFPWHVWSDNTNEYEYNQNHKPVREQDKAVGHAVRAVYLYSGMADVARETGDKGLFNACKALWNSITQKRMYITGAIGSAYEGEAFTADYHLPNSTAYAETCAAIGLIFFARRMLELEINSAYADVMERALYNCVLAGMELDGTKFFYVNPLEVIPGISGVAQTHRHVKPQRPGWFFCACCPPNAARLISSLGSYAWGISGDTVFSHLFVASGLTLENGKVLLNTDYPSGGILRYSFKPEKNAMEITLAIRLPDWSKGTQVLLNGKPADYEIIGGYAYVKGVFSTNDVVEVRLDMSVRRIYSNPKVAENSGKAAFSCGPLVYCAEGADNDGDVLSLYAKRNGGISFRHTDELGGVEQIVVEGYRAVAPDTLYSYESMKYKPQEIVLTPYYSWGNRGLNQMRVWMPETGLDEKQP